MELFGKAIAQDRSKPRAVNLMSRWELGCPDFWGPVPDKACGMARMSIFTYIQQEEQNLRGPISSYMGRSKW